MLNHITLQGRLTKDPELRYTRSNTPVASFTVAVERDFGEKDGVRPVDFIDCVAWKSRGEFVSKYFHKGDMIVVSGRLQIREWVDRNNKNRTSAEIVVENEYFGSSKKDENAGQTEYAPAEPRFEDIDDNDPDFPF